MITIKSLTDIPTNDLYLLFNQAFEDYLRTWTKTEFEKMISRNGFNAELSFGAFEENNLVSFTFNGVGNFNGVFTAYDTGTGTLKGFRGKGLASKIFNYATPFLKQKGAQQYLLEVLEDNKPAVSLYLKQGFEIKRKLNVFKTNKMDWKPIRTTLSNSVELREIDFSYMKEMEIMWDFYPSWQNNFNALLNATEGFKIIGAFEQNVLISYGIIEVATGSIPQLAVSKAHRRRGIGSAIFTALQKFNQAELIKFVNTDAACEHVTAFIEKNGLPKFTSQHEMIKEL